MPKVLVVDDSVSVRKVVERALAGRQVDVVSAASGGEALERIEAEAPDVIVCDVVMPDRDGYEICDFVKNHPRLAATPVILMSGIVNDEVRQRAEQARSEGVLSKPFAAEDLLKRLDSVIGPLPPRSAEPPAPTIATPTLMPVSPLTVEPVGAPEPSSRPDPAASITSMLESLIATDADRRAAATPAPVVDARLAPPRPPMRESLGADAGTSSVSPVREADAAPSAPLDVEVKCVGPPACHEDPATRIVIGHLLGTGRLRVEVAAAGVRLHVRPAAGGGAVEPSGAHLVVVDMPYGAVELGHVLEQAREGCTRPGRWRLDSRPSGRGGVEAP